MQPAADPLIAQRKHRWPCTAVLLQQECRRAPRHMQGFSRGQRKPAGCRASQGSRWQQSCCFPAPLSPSPVGRAGKQTTFAWSKVDGGLEDAAVACWGTGGGTREGWSSTCSSQGLCPVVGGKPVHAWRPSASMLCCAAGAYSSINKSFGIWLLIYTKVSVLFC